MLHHLPLATGLILLVASGVLHGLWTQRWWPSRDLETATARLNEVPLRVGEWQGRDVPMGREVVERSGLAACWTRRYTHAGGRRGVTVVLMCGRAGPTSVHTPEWCYGGAGYERLGVTARHALEWGPGRAAEFWTADFRRPSATAPSFLRIFWAWSPDGVWSAPGSPRITFARHEALYKLYVLRETEGTHEPLSAEPCLDFLRELLPVLERTLFPPTNE